jgi:hypothetical protein
MQTEVVAFNPISRSVDGERMVQPLVVIMGIGANEVADEQIHRGQAGFTALMGLPGRARVPIALPRLRPAVGVHRQELQSPARIREWVAVLEAVSLVMNHPPLVRFLAKDCGGADVDNFWIFHGVFSRWSWRACNNPWVRMA